MTTSEVSIANQALTWLGQNTITSLDQNSTTAIWMRANYDSLRDAVLEERMWTFATVKYTSTSNVLDEWGTHYVHAIPPNWLAVFRVYKSVSQYSNQPAEFRREADGIVSAEATLYLWGIKQITDSRKFPSLFVQTLAARLAADAAIPLTENRQLQVDMWGLYQDKLAVAATRDGQQGTNESIRNDSLLRARSGGGLGGGYRGLG